MYYTSNGEYYETECPFCGATLTMPYGPLKQTAERTMTPAFDTVCTDCGHLSMRPGDRLEYRKPGDREGR